MNSLYTLALRQSSTLQTELTALSNDPAASSSAQNGQITASLSALERTVDDYENMAQREILEDKKEKAMTRVSRLREDHAALRKQFTEIKATGSTLKAAEDRNALLGAPSTAFSSSTSTLGGNATSSRLSRNPSAQNNTPESPFTINMSPNSPPSSYSSSGTFQNSIHNNSRTNRALDEHSFFTGTSDTLDSYIAQGQAVLGNLANQRDMLKGTKRRLLSAANTLGLSRTTIQYIERRTTGDFYILIGGAIFTLFSFYLILKYFG